MGLSGEREGQPGQAVRPSPLSLNWTGKGSRRPPFLLPLPLLPSPSLPFGGNLLGLGVLVGFPSWGRAKEGRPASPSLLYIRGEGVTLEHIKVDCLVVCGAPLHRIPPRSYRCSA